MKKQLMAGMMAASMALSLAACGGSAASSAALGSRQHQRRCLYQHRSFHFQQ